MSYIKGSQLPSTSTVADTDTLIVTQEGDSKATKKVAKSDLLKEDRTRLTNLETDNTTNKSNITNLQQENQTLKNNVKALEYVINNSNRLNYTGEIITNSNSAVGDIRNIIVNGNTRYKKSNGTYTDTWESGVSLESVGEKEKNNNGKYPISVATCGKNLAFTATSSGNVKLNTIVDTNKLVVGKQYVISAKHIDTTKKVHMCFYKSDGTKVSNTYDASSPLKFTYSKDIDNITFSTEDVWTWCNVIDIQLEKGTTATTYEAYKEDKRTILLEKPLRKIGSISDFADFEKKQVTRNCGVKILDGSETWGKESLTRTNTSLFYLSLTSSIFAKAGKCLSDKLSYNYNIYSTDEEGIRIDANGNLQISILKSKLATDNVTGFKTWLVSNNVTVVYQLATPTTESIEISPLDNDLTSYIPSTTLTTNNVVKGNISADMPTNVANIITQQASAIASLQDTVLETQSALIESEYSNLI